MKEISVNDLHKLLKSRSEVFILDVRTDDEFAYVNLGGLNIELGKLPNSIEAIPKNSVIYCLCHHGVRSSMAVDFLLNQGFDAYNIKGGIDAWSLEIDSNIKRY